MTTTLIKDYGIPALIGAAVGIGIYKKCENDPYFEGNHNIAIGQLQIAGGIQTIASPLLYILSQEGLKALAKHHSLIAQNRNWMATCIELTGSIGLYCLTTLMIGKIYQSPLSISRPAPLKYMILPIAITQFLARKAAHKCL